MNKKRILAITFLIICSAFLFFNSNLYINNQNWKYRNGYHVGDTLNRDVNISSDETLYCLGYILIIKNNKTSEKGYYIKNSSTNSE